jgi:polysaccharide deacetylase family protein (PEP-CTERM system associated)
MNILTFDIEEWYHLLDVRLDISESQKNHTIVANFVENILENLEEINTKATFFCLGESAKKFPSVIKKIHQAGHDIGTHSYAHNLVYQQSKIEFQEDLMLSIDILENIIQEKVIFYRAPGFSIKSARDFFYLEALNKAGIKVDSSIYPAIRSHGGISSLNVKSPSIIEVNKSFELVELPISLSGIGNIKFPPLGGGYFRLFPKEIISYILKKNKYNMSYLHPRDFITDQPKLDLPLFKFFKSYIGIKNASKKLEYIFERHNFTSISNYLSSIDLSKLERIAIETQKI